MLKQEVLTIDPRQKQTLQQFLHFLKLQTRKKIHNYMLPEFLFLPISKAIDPKKKRT